MTENGNNPNPVVSPPQSQRRRSSLPILILAVLFVSATFLTWYFTWFGRDLNSSEISTYLTDEKHPRHVQHALLQIEQRLERGEDCRQWYSRILELAGNSETEFRLTTAWLMGYDNKSEEFHQALLKLLRDRELMVRRNASLALVRFNDSSGHDELLATLKPFPVAAPANGTVTSTLNQGSAVSRGTLLARLQETGGAVAEVRSPLPGKIANISSRDGAGVGAGNTILTISSDANSLWEVLRGLALIGQAQDLTEIEPYARGVDSLPDRIKEQAALTIKAIQNRSTQNGQKSQSGPMGQTPMR